MGKKIVINAKVLLLCNKRAWWGKPSKSEVTFKVLNNFELSLIVGHNCRNSRKLAVDDDKVISCSILRSISLLLTPKSFLLMILMATFCPVRMCRPNLTLAKPPGKTNKRFHSVEEKKLHWQVGYKLWKRHEHRRYLSRWSRKPHSICRARRLRGSLSFPRASSLFQPYDDKPLCGEKTKAWSRCDAHLFNTPF